MSAFTDVELAYLDAQPLMRFATASPDGKPDVAPVVFSVDGDSIVTAGFDITHWEKMQLRRQATSDGPTRRTYCGLHDNITRSHLAPR